MQHDAALRAIIAILLTCSSSNSSILLKDALALIQLLLLSSDISSSLKVRVLESLLACTAASDAADTSTTAAGGSATPNIERALMAISILRMFLVEARQPLPPQHAGDVASLATHGLTTVMPSSNVLRLTHAAARTLQVHAIAVLLVCLPSSATSNSSQPLSSSPSLSAAPHTPHPSPFPSSHPSSLPLLLRVARHGFVTLLVKAAVASIQHSAVGCQQLHAKDCLSLVRRITINVPTTAGSGSIASELEHCIPDLFVCISSGQINVQHGAMLCLLAMFEGDVAFPNAINKFLQMDGYGSIFRMLKAIAASSLSSSSSSATDINSFKLLSEGCALIITFYASHVTFLFRS